MWTPFLALRMYKNRPRLKQPVLCPASFGKHNPGFLKKEKKVSWSKVSQACAWPIVISFFLNEVTLFLVSVIWFGRAFTSPELGRWSPELAKPGHPNHWIVVLGSRHMILNEGQWDVKTAPGLLSLQVQWKERDYFLMGESKEEWSHETCWRPSCDPRGKLA